MKELWRIKLAETSVIEGNDHVFFQLETSLDTYQPINFFYKVYAFLPMRFAI